MVGGETQAQTVCVVDEWQAYRQTDSNEKQRALEAPEQGEYRILPIPWRYVGWGDRRRLTRIF